MDTTDVMSPIWRTNTRGFGLDRVWLAAAKLPKRGLGRDGAHPGLFLHPVLAVDPADAGVIVLVDRVARNRAEGRVGAAKTGTQNKHEIISPGACDRAAQVARSVGEVRVVAAR